jgi:SAM-dependent methyltransferase
MLLTLKSREQNDLARQRLEEKNCSVLSHGIGDRFKSWDLEIAIDILDNHVKKTANVLDIGAFCSEMCPSLSMLGYKNLYAVDLNKKLLEQPFADRIHYAIGDFYHTAAVDSSFHAVTAISVIEHGYDPDTMFAEISRVLKPGGLFIASYDYWPEKISTESVVSFGMEWIIFSRPEVEAMIDHAAKYDLELLDSQRDYAAGEPHIRYNGFNYTFGLAVFKKK